MGSLSDYFNNNFKYNMKSYIKMSACALFFLIQVSVQEGASSGSWNYALSGANWRDKDCVNGKRQSPIDIPLFNDTK